MFDCVYPYPCEYYGDSLKPYTCAPVVTTKHRKLILGLILNLIDIHIEVPKLGY